MSAESSGAGTLEGLPSPPAACPRVTGNGQAMADRHSAVQLAPRLGGRAGKRVRGDRGDNPDQGLRPQTLKGRNPGEHPAAGGLIAHLRTRDSRKGKSPEAAATRAGSPLRRLVNRAEKTARGCIRAEIAPETFREEKAPKGESHERCRRETKPARARREETARRVAKP
jgi:hypothetical protein